MTNKQQSTNALTSKNIANRLIVSCAGLRLSPEERSLFEELKPWGVILFARNIESPSQLKLLLDDFRLALQHEQLMVLIDQEGGRVSRLPQPHWRLPPSPQVFAKMYQHDPTHAIIACFLNHQLIAHELKNAGINVNCAPMLDVPQTDAAGIIHERAFGANIQQVIDLGKAAIDGLQSMHVEPVLKHMPGHGRGRSDSHFALPKVEADISELEAVDFAPFLAFKHQSMGMSAHIVYEDIDAQLPGSISPKVIEQVIRGSIDFDGLLMTDDINMQALSGSVAQRSQAAWSAGADIVLHCSGDFEEMRSLLSVVPPLEGESLRRAKTAENSANKPLPEIDPSSIIHELNQLLKYAERFQ